MKSSYELAMERLGKTGGPERKVTDEQKRRIAELDSVYKAKIAELEIGMEGRIAAARAAGDAEQFEKLKQQLVIERQKLRDDCEAKKEKVRQGK
ncbi:MAG: hypothetical protein HZA91_12800 [Verrucomicrobia bacterium]|nr:hypothetical protein [Verrucomicrobiota bacterium]